MSVRFVVGRAGSGKTHHCLEAVRHRLRENPVDGPRLLLMVPEQASFQMEQALIATPDVPGYTRCEVLSFQRLAYRVFAETGVDPRRGDQTIGKLGRLMVLRRLIGKAAGSLGLLGSVADKPGLVKQVAATLDELMRENIEPGVLLELADRRADADPLAAAKLNDLHRIYLDYLEYLSEDRLDPAQYLTLAAERLGRCAWLADAEIWVDGFAGFTQQEKEMLVALSRVAANMEIAFLLDPSASALHSDDLPAVSYSLFARTERTLVQLRKLFRGAGVTIASPLVLPVADQRARMPRFRKTALGRLEACLFGSASDKPCDDHNGIQVQQFPDRRVEVEAVVAEIEKLTHGPQARMRYRDIAVIVRDLAVYEDLLAVEFKARGIACFIDHRQPTTHSPLVELVRALLAIAADDCRLESVRLTLKTGLLPIERQDGELLENYLLAHGIQGRSHWRKPWPYTHMFRHKERDGSLTPYQQGVLKQVNAVREAWLNAVDSWLESAAGVERRSGREWAAALFGCLERNRVAERLQTWANADEQDGLTDEAQVHRQVWVDFLELLDEFVHALGDEAMDVHAFRETIESGLAEFDLGLAPPTLDQVLVGSIERSRQPELRAAFVLGFDQVHYPLRRFEDPLLGDAEREALEGSGRSVGASRRRQILDERMLVYILLTRPSEYLWLSYPRTEADGEPCEPSAFLPQVLEAVPGLTVGSVDDPRQTHAPVWLNRVADLGARLAAAMRYRPVLAQESNPGRRAVWNGLYEACRHRPEWHDTLRRSLAGLAHQNRAVLEPALISSVLKQPATLSVSRLERFAACRFAHFVEFMLRLEPDVEAVMEPLDVGNLCHAILEKFIDGLARRKARLADLDFDQIRDQVDGVIRELMPKLTDDLMLADARNAYVSQRAREQVLRVSHWQKKSAQAGVFRPAAVEFPFGYSGEPTAPFTLTTPKGRVILLRGRIDRVDVAELANEVLGVVIDYKATTDRKLDMTKVYHGLSMQLAAYMLALQQAGHSLTGRPIRPVAAFYLPLLEVFENVDHPEEDRSREIRWRGVMDFSNLGHLDRGASEAGKSDYYSANITRDGRPYANSDMVGREQLTAMMAHVGRRMGELADGILDGDISVNPYRLRRQLPCGFCKYQAVCRYGIDTQPPRRLDSYRKQDVFEMLTVHEKPQAGLPGALATEGGAA